MQRMSEQTNGIACQLVTYKKAELPCVWQDDDSEIGMRSFALIVLVKHMLGCVPPAPPLPLPFIPPFLSLSPYFLFALYYF